MELAAGIAGLISLADVVIFKGTKFCKLVKHGVPEIQGLLKEVINLVGALSSLEKHIKLFNSICDEHNLEQSNSVLYIEDCRKCILELEAIVLKCGPRDDSTWQKAKSSLKWPISASETRELAQKVERLKSTIAMSLDANSLQAMCKILSTQKSVQEDLQRIQKEQRRVAKLKERKSLDSRQEKILDWFSTYRSRKHSQMKKVRHPGTSVWFRDCQEYKNWLQNPNSRLWFDGIPGAGKSVLTSAIIEDLQLQMDEKVALGYFYIEYSELTSQSFHTMAGSLLRQLVEQNHSALPVLDHFRQGFEKDEDFTEAKLQDIISVFKEVSEYFSTTMLVIDGLDECDVTQDRRDILSFISHLGAQATGSIKLLTTSRNIYDIKTRLSDFPNISIAARSTDVKLYVAAELDSRLKSDVEFYGIELGDPSLKGEILYHLVEKANGMFQWVRCQLDALSRTSGDENKRTALKNLPRDLPETYRRILDRVGLHNRGLVREILTWVGADWFETPATHKQIITLPALIDMMAHKFHDSGFTKRDIHLGCGSLVRFDDENRVLFSHFSVKEFLSSDKECEKWYFLPFDEDDFTEAYVLSSLDYLSNCTWKVEKENRQCGLSLSHSFSDFLSNILPNIFGWPNCSSFYRMAMHTEKVSSRLREIFSPGSIQWPSFSYHVLHLMSVSLPKEDKFSSDLDAAADYRLHFTIFLGLSDMLDVLMGECRQVQPLNHGDLSLPYLWGLMAWVTHAGCNFELQPSDIQIPLGTIFKCLHPDDEIDPKALFNILKVRHLWEDDVDESEIAARFRKWCCHRDRQEARVEFFKWFKHYGDIDRPALMCELLVLLVDEIDFSPEERTEIAKTAVRELAGTSDVWVSSITKSRQPGVAWDQIPYNSIPKECLVSILENHPAEIEYLLRIDVQNLLTEEQLIDAFQDVLTAKPYSCNQLYYELLFVEAGLQTLSMRRALITNDQGERLIVNLMDTTTHYFNHEDSNDGWARNTCHLVIKVTENLLNFVGFGSNNPVWNSIRWTEWHKSNEGYRKEILDALDTFVVGEHQDSESDVLMGDSQSDFASDSDAQSSPGLNVDCSAVSPNLNCENEQHGSFLQQKRRCTQSFEEGEDCQQDIKRTKNTLQQSVGASHNFLACPYAKGDPNHHVECWTVMLEDITSTQSHLVKHHMFEDLTNSTALYSWEDLFYICFPDWDGLKPRPTSNFNVLDLVQLSTQYVNTEGERNKEKKTTLITELEAILGAEDIRTELARYILSLKLEIEGWSEQFAARMLLEIS